VKFALLNASADVRLSTLLGASPWRRTVGAYGNGDHNVFLNCRAEMGLALGSDTGSSVTAEVVYTTAEHAAWDVSLNRKEIMPETEILNGIRYTPLRRRIAWIDHPRTPTTTPSLPPCFGVDP
jgi:hypothetical protein